MAKQLTLPQEATALKKMFPLRDIISCYDKGWYQDSTGKAAGILFYVVVREVSMETLRAVEAKKYLIEKIFKSLSNEYLIITVKRPRQGQRENLFNS